VAGHGRAVLGRRSGAELFVENGVSALDRGKVRSQYRRMLGAVRSGEVDAVIVCDIDRL
jgi:DNA invertase Pin-like site-specific DNA recombinase